jgi:hypothetical protein
MGSLVLEGPNVHALLWGSSCRDFDRLADLLLFLGSLGTLRMVHRVSNDCSEVVHVASQ